MLTPLPLFNQGNSQALSPDRSNTFAGNHSLNKSNGAGDSQVRGLQRDNFAIFNDILQKAYQRMAFSPSDAGSPPDITLKPHKLDNTGSAAQQIPGYQQVDSISSEQAANTILDFISQRLKLDEAEGATQEELLSRLDEGLKGFIKGFNEAKDIIEGMGLLTPQLSAEIGDTYNRVTEGVDKLRESINGADDIKGADSLATPLVSRLSLAGESSVSESFSLELTTQDGDKVSIDISRSAQTRFASSFENSGSSSKLSIGQQSASSHSFSLKVDGELDEGEMLAINQLLEDVDQIAADFFEGDLDAAFNLALELDINRQELSSLNLELKKTTSVQALAAYESISEVEPGIPAKHFSSSVGALSNLLDNIDKIMSEASVFAEPLKLLGDISNQLERLNDDGQKQVNHAGNSLSEMIQSLVDKFEL